jgi:hypothetical protein
LRKALREAFPLCRIKINRIGHISVEHNPIRTSFGSFKNAMACSVVDHLIMSTMSLTYKLFENYFRHIDPSKLGVQTNYDLDDNEKNNR